MTNRKAYFKHYYQNVRKQRNSIRQKLIQKVDKYNLRTYKRSVDKILRETQHSVYKNLYLTDLLNLEKRSKKFERDIKRKIKSEINRAYYKRVIKPRNKLLKQIYSKLTDKVKFRMKANKDDVVQNIVQDTTKKYIDTNELHDEGYYDRTKAENNYSSTRNWIKQHFGEKIRKTVYQNVKEEAGEGLTDFEQGALSEKMFADIISDILEILLL